MRRCSTGGAIRVPRLPGDTTAASSLPPCRSPRSIPPGPLAHRPPRSEAVPRTLAYSAEREPRAGGAKRSSQNGATGAQSCPHVAAWVERAVVEEVAIPEPSRIGAACGPPGRAGSRSPGRPPTVRRIEVRLMSGIWWSHLDSLSGGTRNNPPKSFVKREAGHQQPDRSRRRKQAPSRNWCPGSGRRIH